VGQRPNRDRVAYFGGFFAGGVFELPSPRNKICHICFVGVFVKSSRQHTKKQMLFLSCPRRKTAPKRDKTKIEKKLTFDFVNLFCLYIGFFVSLYNSFRHEILVKILYDVFELALPKIAQNCRSNKTHAKKW
jgi:hypothetical protein